MLKPIKTEKSHALASSGRYTFMADLLVNKTDIKRSVEKLFGVTVAKVQTAIMPGKDYRTGKRSLRKTRSDWKKAIVTVKSGQKIDLWP